MMGTFLAGPMVRRVEKHKAYIWYVTSSATSFSGKLFRETNGNMEDRLGEVSTQSVRLGPSLFVHLMCLKPNADFEDGEILYYDICDGQTSLLKENADFVYENELYPSFIFAAKLKTILHGSCRKPHAKIVDNKWGGTDQLSVGSRVVQASLKDKDTRPSMLILSGDQIYADDVASPILEHLIALGRDITGWDEILPRQSLDLNLPGDDAMAVADVALRGRKPLLNKKHTGFTSAEKQNHLMTFGEYASMYITVFGGKIPQFQGLEKIIKKLSFDDGFITRKTIYNAELKRCKAFVATLPKVRLLLANISVYMMLDDHEVTDDWNLNQTWETKVQSSPRGTRVVANALAAYWAFQGWGNNPDQYDKTFISKLTKHLNNQSYAGTDAKDFDDLLWEKDPARWSYSIPTDTPVVTVDTRTNRSSAEGAKKAPKLMNHQALDWLKNTMTGLQVNGAKHFILVSPSPVFGQKTIEAVQRAAARRLGAYAVDLERWREGLGDLNYCIGLVSPVPVSIAILSGDVHYSFVKKDAFNPNQKKVRAIQLTSSALLSNPIMKLELSKKDVLMQDESYVAVEEKSIYGQDSRIALTSMYNIAQLYFENNEVSKQVLRSDLANGSEHTYTYIIMDHI